MIHFSLSIALEFFFGLFLWWVAVYIFSQNPFSRLIGLISAIFVVISFYLSSDIFFYATHYFHQNYLNKTLWEIFAWTLYLSPPLFYHISFLLLPVSKRELWQKILLYFFYLLTILATLIDAKSGLIRNFQNMTSPNFSGDFSDAINKHFWLIGAYMMPVLAGATLNFYLLLKSTIKYSRDWYKIFWPFLGLCSSLIIGPIIIISYYKIIPHSDIYTSLFMVLVAVPFIYSIIKYKFLVEESKVVFGRLFIYSTLAIAILVTLYLLALFSEGAQFTSTKSFIVPFIIIYLLFISHPLYSWMTTFVNDIVYNASSGFSVVNDQEVGQAIKSYCELGKLENSTLLRLNSVSKKLKKNEAENPVDALCKIIKESIKYFKPEDNSHRRIKKNLKYHLLTMLAFDQAEEGQMLWELGFEEYPVAIMTRESRERKPLFKTESPSDYYYISRNAYLALKKEAIHDVAWRISYLEKLAK